MCARTTVKKDLLGVPYIQLEDLPTAKKSIATTRSFQNNLQTFWEVEEQITTMRRAVLKNCVDKKAVVLL